MTVTRPRCWVDRVIDSDTLSLWIEATPDCRIRYRARLVGIEGGEIGTTDGTRGTQALTELLQELAPDQLHWHGSFLTRDQHGRLVGDVMTNDGRRITAILRDRGTHWRRNKSGTEFRS